MPSWLKFGLTWRWRGQAMAWGLALLSITLVWLASATRPWLALENQVLDLFTSVSAPHQSHLPLVILAIDEPTFQQLQTQWPFPRRLHAQVLQRLSQDGALAVGFDVVFAEPSNPADDDALARAIQAAPPVVLGAARELTESGNASLWTEVPPLEVLLQAGAIVGQSRVSPDTDFVVRKRDSGSDTFAARLAELATPASESPTPQAWADLLEYAGPRGTFDTRSYYQALEPGLLPAGFFKNKIVLIGRSVRTASELARSQTDMFNSPFSVLAGADRLIPGVEIQANLISNLLTQGGRRTLPDSWAMALLLLMALALMPRRAHPALTAALALALSAAAVVLSYWLFAVQKLWLSPVFLVLALLTLYGTLLLLNFITARQRVTQTRLMFSQYVPQEVVSRLVDNPALLKLGGEVRELTLMFTDLANFTAMSERLSAESTVAVLTEYFNAMTPVIHHYGGTVDKFIGDAVMAFWGAPLDDPHHAEHAVHAAIAMQEAMQALTERLVQRGLPSLSMRIGIHTGRVVVGNVGSHSRFSYTAIGDAVNLAARLEGANKAFGTGILISSETASSLPAQLQLRHLDSVIVKGKSAPVKVYTPCTDALLCEISSSALALFYQQRWDASAAAFRQLLTHKPGDLAALRFLSRIDGARFTAPDPGWTGALSLDKL